MLEPLELQVLLLMNALGQRLRPTFSHRGNESYVIDK